MIKYKKFVRNVMLTYVSNDKRCCSKMCTLHNLIHTYNFHCKDCKFYISSAGKQCACYSSKYGIR